MTAHNFIVVTFAESSKAYEALSDIRQAAQANRIVVPAAIIAEREPDGHLHLAEGEDARIGDGAFSGGLIGMVVGILGGPLGMLLGWGAGALAGGFVDVERVNRAETAIGEFSSRLPAGTTAIFAEAREYAPEVLDGLVAPLDGVVVRRPAEEVLAELEAAQEAAKAAHREATRVMREERRQERRENWDERIARLKERFHRKG
ncbi:MAG: DUF1269 domain-containing protein [Actinomyces succiniciruminis]|uniref:DUF1269 domain-containing protein n=1 Tax=Actinomyces succiniciruminis TaxID=1522002 RepID=A0A1L7RPE8_9ACTO|nr:DUF1269 domain-containing protein [Actinomyces succiniciruminis]MBM6979240.1 DUF1269 domain-containing protein [Actinomyces succiniciruminis]CED91388.1 Protein of unknown function (DUF1269) [Actinomyces succiniciruminis]